MTTPASSGMRDVVAISSVVPGARASLERTFRDESRTPLYYLPRRASA